MNFLTLCYLIKALLVLIYCTHILHIWGNQLVPELLLKPSDTLKNNVDTLNFCMKKKFDAIQILFDKMTAF